MSEQSKTIVETEWSYFVDVEELESGRTELSISPSDEEKHRLCQRLGVASIESLQADLVITGGSGAASFHVVGRMEADIVQDCVVTLEPVTSHIEDDFESWFADPDAAVSIAKARHEKLTEKGHGEQPILDESDDPEPLVEGKMDLGELVTQYLSLAINPYPHAEGVSFEQLEEAKSADGGPVTENPFAALKDWKDKLGSDGEA